MLRTSIGLVLSVAVLWSGGCAPESEKQDLEFALHKTERERDTLARQVSSAEAKILVLERRVESDEYQRGADRAEVNALREQLHDVTQRNAELEGVVKARQERLGQPLERPAVPGSPLPAAVDEALQAFATRLSDRVTYDRGRAAISFANDQLFASGSAVVRPEAHGALHDLAGILGTMSAEEIEVIIVGHTDSDPIRSDEVLAEHPSNWHLSVHRAIGVKDVLVQGGLPAARIGVMGYAEHRPIGADRAQNRRVEVYIVRTGEIKALEPVQPDR